MPTGPRGAVGRRIAYHRRVARMTQQELATAANIHVGTLRKIERGARGVGDAVLTSIAAAIGIDPSLLLADREQAKTRARQALPAVSAALAMYEFPDEGPVRPLPELHAVTDEAVSWRLGAEYARIAHHAPNLLTELFRSFHRSTDDQRIEISRLIVSACRSADAVAYKFGAYDLSARLIDLMRWAAAHIQDRLIDTMVAYVRTETYFAAHAYAAGLRMVEHAIDSASSAQRKEAIAALGALHMRAAVLAGRAGDADIADAHLAEARRLAVRLPEGVYMGTAFGPSSVRIHEVSVAVSLGSDHVHRALQAGCGWTPPRELPAERRSGFYIELARAQLWAGRPDDAFESLKTARRIAPQHTRDHQWVREDAATLRRLKRADAQSLTNFAEWCQAI